MGAIIPALMHRIPSELRTSILEFIGPSLDSGIYWPSSTRMGDPLEVLVLHPLLIDFYLNFHLVWRGCLFVDYLLILNFCGPREASIHEFIGPFRLRSYHLNN
ncbi:hypothetical protein ACJIZ3_000563 [Penstemon smallii]|uniref:Uncharacterized protein n=1 Tax=Penstemon smallii TaxID=265156 RepID=A0ABD3R1U0_9LAMI